MSTTDDTTLEAGSTWHSLVDGEASVSPALVWIWSRRERDRLGEVCLFEEDGVESTIGRGDGDVGERRAPFVRQRPGKSELAPPIEASSISRSHLRVRRAGADLQITREGRSALLINGSETDRSRVRPGDVVTIKGQAAFLCVERPSELPAARHWPERESFRFSAPDRFGIIGESPSAWALRERLAFCAQGDQHVLVLGPSGTGKELAARAIHALSARAAKDLLSRSAATLPKELVDAELFGNRADYPNPGMPEREGLIGAADGATLFLDEIGELPEALQAHLLRVLDEGEYTRLGESRSRVADLRLVSATNRDPAELKHDLVARHVLRVQVPSLAERREDVPSLAHHLLRAGARDQPALADRFFEGDEPRVAYQLIESLVRHDYTSHVRELERLLWLALQTSPGDVVALTPEVEAELHVAAPAVVPDDLTAEQLQAALEAAGGNRTVAAEQLGLPSRFALYRLLKKLGLESSG